MRAGSPSRALAAAFSSALVLTVLLVGVPSSQAGFVATTSNVGNSFASEGWKAILALDGGQDHACLARAEGSVWCWGLNDKGQLGDTTTTDRWTPIQVTGAGGSGVLTNVIDVAGGSRSTCVAQSSGDVWCWGLNDKGQLGDTTTTDTTSPVQVTGPGGTGTLTGAVDVAAGLVHSCALKTDTTVWCWGRNDKGQLGDATTTDTTSPVQVTGPGGTGTLTGVASITAGASFTCATKSDGTMWCWGDNGDGQLGDATTTDTTSPVQVTGPGGTGALTGVKEASAGESFTCAVKTDTTVWCWGRNDKVQLGDLTTTNRTSPVQVVDTGGVGTLTGASTLAAGLKHACVVKTDGTVWCWGDNSNGQRGDTTTITRKDPHQVAGPGGTGTLTGAVLVGAGDLFSCAALDDYTAWCWGANNKGQLGDNTTIDRSSPVQVKGGGWTGVFADATGLATGLSHTCAVKSDGTVWCWGRNDRGQLGDATTANSFVPVQVSGPGGTGTLTGVDSITAGASFTCATKTDTTIWCWGDNSDGQLGDTTTTDATSPVQVTGPGGTGTLIGVTEAAAGETFICAVKTDTTVWCWGRNDKGQLGDSTTTNRTSPVQVVDTGGVGTLTGASTVAAGLKHACVVKTDGTVWCWGLNDKGQLGDTTTTDALAPVQVTGPGGTGTLIGAVGAELGDAHSCVVLWDATVRCWGLNDKGQLGDTTTTDALAPVQVTGPGGTGTLSGAAALEVGTQYSCTVKGDATVWCWGLNNKGQLGDSTTTDALAPVQVTGSGGTGTVTDAAVGAAGHEHTCAIRSGGTTWCWGENANGQLGNGTTTDSSSPTQVL